MKLTSAKSTLSLCVAVAMAGPALAYDGYDYSGQSARSQALQLDYFSHRDVGNIWVNPALVRHYSNRVMININNNNNDGQGSGGVLLGSGEHTFDIEHTIGIYIGRDSVSSMGEVLDLVNFDNETGAALGGLQPAVEAHNPESQFDLFYGYTDGDFAVGVRLNLQNNQQDVFNDRGTFAFLNTVGAPTFATLDEALAHRNANIEAQFADDPNQPTPAALVFTGSAEAGSFNDGHARLAAKEYNLSLGFEIASLGLDGAVLHGQASGSYSVMQSFAREELTLENDGDDNQVVRRIYREDLSVQDALEIDDGITLGITMRLHLMESQSVQLLTSFAYVSQEYTANFTGRGQGLSTLWDDDPANLREGSIDERFGTSGTVVNESELIRLSTAYELRPNNRAAITLVSGIELREMDNSFSYAISEDVETIRADVDGFFGLSEGESASTFGETGPQARRDQIAEFMRVPLVIALEYHLNDRWTGRTSVARDLYHETETTEITYLFDAVQDADVGTGSNRRIETNRERMGSSESWVRQPTRVQIGFGYLRDGLGIDALVGKEFFTESTDNGLFAAVGFGYSF
jgi:hypothetical protein